MKLLYSGFSVAATPVDIKTAAVPLVLSSDPIGGSPLTRISWSDTPLGFPSLSTATLPAARALKFSLAITGMAASAARVITLSPVFYGSGAGAGKVMGRCGPAITVDVGLNIAGDAQYSRMSCVVDLLIEAPLMPSAGFGIHILSSNAGDEAVTYRTGIFETWLAGGGVDTTKISGDTPPVMSDYIVLAGSNGISVDADGKVSAKGGSGKGFF